MSLQRAVQEICRTWWQAGVVASSNRSWGILLRGAVAVALIALVGVLFGHFVWSAASTLRLTPAFNRAFGPFRDRGGGSSRQFGGGASAGEGEEGAAGARASGEAARAVTAKVDPGLVDINTQLGLEGGAAAGTGMVVSSTGEVITNNHVITGATNITATDVGSGRTYTARVVGYDYSKDIAVLQLEGASGLSTVPLGDSQSLAVGQSVATIGNAGGVGGTPRATSGRVSALDQSITAGDEIDGGQEHLSGLVEVEGDVQPGDSGGPLVNGSGEVLAMDTAASSTFQFRSSANQAFAIPIDEVRAIASQIVGGEASSTVHIGATGLLGVLVVSPRGEGGALVESVISGAPAAGGGLGAGDLIIGLGGATISSPTGLTQAMLEHHPGEAVRVTWQTPEGVQQSATLTLGSGPPQ
jgi:S1-C subfamily serine protease